MTVMNLTEARIRTLGLGSGIFRDQQVKGLMVICHRTTKTYAVQGDVRRNKRPVRTVRMKIDRVDRIGLAEARRRARELLSQIQSGVDPTATPEETGVTVERALEAHLAERELRPATVDSYREHLDRYLKGLRRRAVADITRAEVRDLLEHIRRRHGDTCATGAMRTLKTLINTAMRIDETITRNPVMAVRLPRIKPREVEALDVADWWKKTDALSPMMRDLHRAFLLTGARRLSLQTVKRADVDLNKRVLRFAHMKRGGAMLFPMGRRLTAMLKTRMRDDASLDSEWLWPTPSKSGHVEEPKRKGLPGPHELRHHARTLMIAAGVPYAESALLLGHKLPGASGGYVHAEHLIEHLRPFAQKYENLVLKRAEGSRRKR